MLGDFRTYLATAFKLDTEAARVILMGSSFCLFVFLTSPDFVNPYYVFGVAVTALAFVFAIATLALERND